uniref:Uncharacterized protein n=1 Tax=Triticum urartu TaxID=4572 RepID=A0A8R7RDT3_TRIUA
PPLQPRLRVAPLPPTLQYISSDKRYKISPCFHSSFHCKCSKFRICCVCVFQSRFNGRFQSRNRCSVLLDDCRRQKSLQKGQNMGFHGRSGLVCGADKGGCGG